MKIINYLSIFLSFLSLTPVLAQQENHVLPGQLLVQVPETRKAENLLTDLDRLNGVNTRLAIDRVVSEPMKIYLLTFDHEAINPDDMLKAVQQHPGISLAQFNHRVYLRETTPNDPQFNQQWHHVNNGGGGATADADIDSDLAWDITTGGTTALGDEIVVCVIEGGNLNHVDLQANKWVNTQEIPNNGVDDDGNGYIDDYNGWNVGSDNDGGVFSGGHGTQVMGMIGAHGDNNLGVVGANWDVKIMSVAGENAQSEASVVEAYTYPLTMRQLYNSTNGASGAFVVATNASWGLNNANPDNHPIWCAVYETLGEHGILNCGATTNSNVNIDNVGDMPTACPSPFMVSVTATDNQDERTFSGYGVVNVDVGSPGDAVFTTTGSDGYSPASGTSFASPLTAGVIGLLYSVPCPSLIQIAKANPQLGAEMVLEALYEGVDVIPNLIGEVATGGRINAHNSLLYLLENCTEVGCMAPFSTAVTQEENTTNYTFSWNGIDALTYDLRYRVVGEDEWIEINDLVQVEYLASDLLYCTTYEFQVRAHCEEESSEYSASVEWTTDGCCENPMLSVGDLSPTSAGLTWESVLAAESFNIRYRVQGTTNWIEINDIENTGFQLNDLMECSPYEVQIQTNCLDEEQVAFSPSVLFTTTGCGACQDLDYCASGGDNSNEEWIESVEFDGFSNISGNNGGYVDFTDESHLMIIGTEQAFTLTPGFAGGTFPERFRIWVDYNQDGAFSETELVYDSGAGGTSAVSGNFTIPETALIGSTRMRIAMKYVGDLWGEAPPPAPCEEFGYGETEDYCVFIGDVNSTDELAQNGISIFPNPAVDELYILFEQTVETGKTIRYQISDMTGRLVMESNINSVRETIDIRNITPGMYMLSIYNGTTRVATEQIVKSK